MTDSSSNPLQSVFQTLQFYEHFMNSFYEIFKNNNVFYMYIVVIELKEEQIYL